MKAELLEWKGNKLSFKVADAELPLLNAIRRYSMVRVPIIAIDKVVMYDNTSSMFDEYVAHRVGLLPVLTPDNTPEEAEIAFALDEVGPKVVYSGDVKTKDPEVKMAKDKIPIITLFEGQSLRFECTARLGNGKKHAKYQAGLAAYGEEEGAKDGVVFKAESFFQMTPKEMLVRGCKRMEKDLEDVVKAVKKAAK